MHFENPLMALPYKDKLGTIKKLLRLMHLVL
jgi:hypothetical protein